jgi:hypothetical protein
MGQPRDAVEALLLPAFLPFNLLKGGLNTAFTLILYKPLVTALRKTGLVETYSPQKGKPQIGIYLLGFGLLITCILLLLILRDIL